MVCGISLVFRGAFLPKYCFLYIEIGSLSKKSAFLSKKTKSLHHQLFVFPEIKRRFPSSNTAFYFLQSPFQFSERAVRFFVSLQTHKQSRNYVEEIIVIALGNLCRILENISGYFVWSSRNRREERRRIVLRLWIIVKRSSIILRCNLRKLYVQKTETAS